MRVTKELKQRILDGEYPKILKKADINKFKKTGLLTKEQEVQIMMQDAFTLKMTVNSPMQHQVIDLGIKAFKKLMRENPPVWLNTKAKVNAAIALYKKKAWIDYKETVGYKGSFPTAPAY